MVRTQIQLTEAQSQGFKQLSIQNGDSILTSIFKSNALHVYPRRDP